MEYQIEVTKNTWLVVSSITHFHWGGNKRTVNTLKTK